ncbi:MAG: hypothetical protein V1702_01280 [Candidatus Woesearchaeota archaeon]
MPELQEKIKIWVAETNKYVWQLRKNLSKKHFFIIAMLILLFILLKYNIKAVAVVTFLGLLASYSTMYKRYLKIPSAVELVTFGTVIVSITVGPTAGAFFGAITTLASEIISASVDIFTFLYVFARAVIGFMAWHLYTQLQLSVPTVGIISALTFILIAAPFYLLPGDFEAKLKVIYFFIVNLGINIIVFTMLGDLVVNFIL